MIIEAGFEFCDRGVDMIDGVLPDFGDHDKEGSSIPNQVWQDIIKNRQYPDQLSYALQRCNRWPRQFDESGVSNVQYNGVGSSAYIGP